MEELPIEKNIQKIMEDIGMAIPCQEAITMLCQKYPGMDNIIPILIDDIKRYQTNEICHFLIDASNGKFVDNSGLKIGIYEKLYMLTHIKPKYFIDSINNALFEFTKSNSKIDKLQYLAYTLKNYGKNAIDLYLQKHPEYQDAYNQLISICQPIEDVLTNYNHSNKHYLISCMKEGENSYYHSCWIINTLSNYCAKLENSYLIQTDMQISEQASYLYMTKKFGTELIDICHPYILERRIFDAQNNLYNILCKETSLVILDRWHNVTKNYNITIVNQIYADARELLRSAIDKKGYKILLPFGLIKNENRIKFYELFYSKMDKIRKQFASKTETI